MIIYLVILYRVTLARFGQSDPVYGGRGKTVKTVAPAEASSGNKRGHFRSRGPDSWLSDAMLIQILSRPTVDEVVPFFRGRPSPALRILHE